MRPPLTQPPPGGFFTPSPGIHLRAFNSRKGTAISVQLPNNLKLFLATAYASADTVSAVSNAAPAVATTSAAHGIVNGQYMEVTSGWQGANQRIFRATGASGSTLGYEGLDSSSTTNYPAGSGIGSVREITSWTQLLQITAFSTSGGDPQYVQYDFLEENFQRQLPNGSSAQSITFSFGDDPTLAGYLAFKAASDAGALVALRLSFQGGSQLVYNGYPFLNETPQISKGQILTTQASFSLSGKPTRYAS